MKSTTAADVVQVPLATLSRYVGTYDTVDDGKKHVATVTFDNSELWLDYDGKGKERLIPLSPTHFSWSGSIVEFAPGTNGAMNIRLHYVEGTETGSRRN